MKNFRWGPKRDEDSSGGRVSTNQDFFENPPDRIQIPGEFFPHAGFTDALWIKMQARELQGIRTSGRGGNLTLGGAKTTFKFLAPPEIIEMHNHDWAEYASIASRLLEKIKSMQTIWQQGSEILDKAGTDLKGIVKSAASGQLSGVIRRVQDAALNVNVTVPQRKIDTPLSYQNSQRRQYQFNFVLADNQGGQKVTQTVKLLQTFAAATQTDVISIGFPHIFRVSSEPEGLLLMEHAAITSIQPTYHYPYKNGYPYRCDLTINFTDMSPLFKKTITEGTIINVVPTEKDLNNPTTDLDWNKRRDARTSINKQPIRRSPRPN